MKALINIGLQAGTKVLRIQRQEATASLQKEAGGLSYWRHGGHWILWLNTSDYINGTYLKLYDNGRIERITIREDEPAPDIMLIKPEDGE